MHIFDEAEVKGMVFCKPGQCNDLTVVDAADDDGIELHGRQPGLGYGFDALPYLPDGSPLGRAFEGVRIDRVQGDVDSVQARFQKFGQASFQETGIGGQGYVFDSHHSSGVFDHLGQFLAKKRLPTGETHRVHAEPSAGLQYPSDFLNGHGSGWIVETFPQGVAIETFVVTTRCNADTQIAHDSPIAVYQRPHMLTPYRHSVAFGRRFGAGVRLSLHNGPMVVYYLYCNPTRFVRSIRAYARTREL